MNFPAFATFLACVVIFIQYVYVAHVHVLHKADRELKNSYHRRAVCAKTGTEVATLGLAQHMIQRAYASRSLRIAVYDKYTMIYEDHLKDCVRSDLNYYHIRWLISLIK